MKKRFLTAMLLYVVFIVNAAAGSIPADSIRKYTDWLYESMNLADRANFTRSFWEKNVEAALESRRDMPWGATVPMREWLHFVLPVRVNNETPDSSRMVFYRELAPRVRNLSMEKAALEVNHWAYEKATYRPSDARTSSPLATVRTTFGRCGEESTLGVAAMRSVGIPARQVYTPRWAHTDDNHAWVEVWIDGKGRFLGACEPEPELDMGWFNSPASQGMMMATNVIGNYRGPEQRLYRDRCYTRINITGNYAPLREATVVVTDSLGMPVSGASVSFRLYNYAELYPLFTAVTDSAGRASLVCGCGDIMAWAISPDGCRYGIAELDASLDPGTTVRVMLSESPLRTPAEFNLTPPEAVPHKPSVTSEQIAVNEMRKAAGDSIRNAVMARFLSPGEAAVLVDGWGDDSIAVAEVLTESYGNCDVMSGFVGNVPVERRHQARIWLENLSRKDWRDIEWDVIDEFFLKRQIPVNPRIANEQLTTWLSDFDDLVPASLRDSLTRSPLAVEEWVNENIVIDNEHNPNRFCISPAGVWRMRRSDTHSRDIFYVALCRWLGFDAGIDPVTSHVLARSQPDENYVRVFHSSDETGDAEASIVKLVYRDDFIPHNPKYYRHFTLSKIENGQPELLNYPEDADLRNFFEGGVSLLPGNYLLTSGRRLADGSVKARLYEFEVSAGDGAVEVPLVLPDAPGAVSVIGAFNADPLLPLTGRGTFIAAFVRPNHEPSAHFINELIDNRSRFEKDARPVVLIAQSEKEALALTEKNTLPEFVKVTADTDGSWLGGVAEEFEFSDGGGELPVVLVADSFNRVMEIYCGYRPGVVDAILEILHRIP